VIVLEKYEILEEVGRGGMGLVYRANDLRLGRVVALKELVLSQAIIGQEKDDIIARFKREAQTAANLNHPNVVTIFDVGEENNRHFIAMEFLPGKTLQDYLSEGHQYSMDELMDILMQISSGLEHAHSKGVVHRDVKPGNMKILDDKTVKIMDFGVARIESSSTQLTQDGTMLGTLGYISPEQLHNSKGVDTRADIFSFGAMMYEIFTNKLPFDGGTVGSTILKIMTENPVLPRKINPEIPEMLENIIIKCLQKDPDKRYQKFKEVFQELMLYKMMLNNPEFATKTNVSTTNPGIYSPPVSVEPVRQAPILPRENPPVPSPPFSSAPRILEVEDSLPGLEIPPEVRESRPVLQSPFRAPDDRPAPVIEEPDEEPVEYKSPAEEPEVLAEAQSDIRIAFVRIIGKMGTAKGQFASPRGIALANQGIVLVADTQNRRIQAFDSFGTWQYLLQASEMQSPCDVAVDSSGKIYAVDSIDNKVRVFDSSGNIILRFGGKGTGPGQFKATSGIAINNDRVYITDTEGYKIQVFNLNGQIQTVFGKYGIKPGEYKSPYGIAVDNQRIYILDYGIPRVQVIDKDGISRLVFGQRGTTKGQFSIPKGVGVDKYGRIYVADTLNHRVQIFDRAGKWLYSFGSKGSGQGQFMGPEGIVIGNDGSIFVLDKGNNRVQVFTYEV
jgi:serine/threonine protein kinase/sugar lactone lactonase YvrE